MPRGGVGWRSLSRCMFDQMTPRLANALATGISVGIAFGIFAAVFWRKEQLGRIFVSWATMLSGGIMLIDYLSGLLGRISPWLEMLSFFIVSVWWAWIAFLWVVRVARDEALRQVYDAGGAGTPRSNN